MTVEIVEKFIKNYKGLNLASDLVGYINKITSVRMLFHQLYQDQEILYKRQKQERKELEDRYAKMRADCPHPEVVNCRDPSGGSDSYSQCTYCGKEF
jgi:hypothetical protein